MNSDREMVADEIPHNDPEIPNYEQEDDDPPLSNIDETWEEYCERHNLVEVEPPSDHESLISNREEIPEPVIEIEQSESDINSELDFDLTSNNWQNRRKKYIADIRNRSAKETNQLLSIIPEYYTSEATIRTLHTEFPLPNHLYRKWKDGIRLWPNRKYSKDIRTGKKDPINIEVMRRLVHVGICNVTVSSPDVSNMFFIINNSKDSLRPIFNYGHMTNSFKTPHFNLPSLFQIIDKYKW